MAESNGRVAKPSLYTSSASHDTTQSFSILAAADDKKAAVKVGAKPRRGSVFWGALLGGVGLAVLVSVLGYDALSADDEASAVAGEWAAAKTEASPVAAKPAQADTPAHQPETALAANSTVASPSASATAAASGAPLALLEAPADSGKNSHGELAAKSSALPGVVPDAAPSAKQLLVTTPAPKTEASGQPVEDELTKAFAHSETAAKKKPTQTRVSAAAPAASKAKTKTKLAKAEPARKPAKSLADKRVKTETKPAVAAKETPAPKAEAKTLAEAPAEKPAAPKAKRGKDPDVELLEAVLSHMKK